MRLAFVLALSEFVPDAIAPILRDAGDRAALREAAVSGLAKHEIPFLRKLLDDSRWTQRTDARAAVITDVARSVTRRDDPKEVIELIDLIGVQPPARHWQQLAMLDAIPQTRQDEFGSHKLIRVEQKPPAIDALAASDDPEYAWVRPTWKDRDPRVPLVK